MFFFIPFGIFVGSLAAIVWVIARKFIFLKKLAPDIIDSAQTTPEGFWAEFFPEIAARLRNINWTEHKVNFLAEFEKFLRRLRLISLRIDTFTNGLIHRVRKTTIEHEEMIKESAESAEAVKAAAVAAPKKRKARNLKELKEEEQLLIIEIAKNPKDAALYMKLGEIYIKTGEEEFAFESFKKAVELEPENKEAQLKLEKLTPKLENKV